MFQIYHMKSIIFLYDPPLPLRYYRAKIYSLKVWIMLYDMAYVPNSMMWDSNAFGMYRVSQKNEIFRHPVHSNLIGVPHHTVRNLWHTI